MFKKFILPISIALLFSLSLGAWGYTKVAAQGNTPRLDLRLFPRALGQVTAIGVDQFTIRTRLGADRTFRFNETTRFTNRERHQLSAGDLKSGEWVAVVAGRFGGEPRLARLVEILPEGFNPENWASTRGKVIDLDLNGNSFTLETKGGQAIKIKVGQNTLYRGQLTGFSELKVGMLAQALTEKEPNGGLLARAVRAGLLAERRFVGRVTALDPHAFTIKTRQGETLTFQVTGETIFRNRRGVIISLDQLKDGMVVAVGANDLDNGRFQAIRVLAEPGMK